MPCPPPKIAGYLDFIDAHVTLAKLRLRYELGERGAELTEPIEALEHALDCWIEKNIERG